MLLTLLGTRRPVAVPVVFGEAPDLAQGAAVEVSKVYPGRQARTVHLRQVCHICSVLRDILMERQPIKCTYYYKILIIVLVITIAITSMPNNYRLLNEYVVLGSSSLVGI